MRHAASRIVQPRWLERQLELISFAVTALGVVWVGAAVVDAAAGSTDTLDLTGVLLIAIGFGLSTRRDGWRLVALGTAFLVIAVTVMRSLLLLGSAGSAWASSSPADATSALPQALVALLATGLGACWAAWVLTRRHTLRLFGNA